MAAEIIMPKAGMAMETGVIVQWFKRPGESVEVGEALLEIETDKVTMEVEAETSGVLLGILHDTGDEVPVTQTIGYIGQAGEPMPEPPAPGESAPADSALAPAADEPPSAPPAAYPAPAAASPAAASPAPAASAHPAPSVRPPQPPPGRASGSGSEGKTAATPAAKRLAAEHSIDLAEAALTLGVSPLHAEELRRFIDRSPGESAVGTPPSGNQQDTAGSFGNTLGNTLAGITGFVPPAPYHFEPEPDDAAESLSGIRKVTARRMVTSHLTIPPTTLHREVNADRLLELKQNIRSDEVKISLNDLFLAAAARALRQCPWMRVGLRDNHVIKRESVHLGMAVASEKGLLVPVIRHAERKSIIQIHDIAADLAERARSGKLQPDEMQGVVFSVSNLGMYGITTFTPIVNPPEAAILGVGTVRRVLHRSSEGDVIERSLIDLSLTVDHRLIDGAQGALFLQELAELIENPVRIVV